MQPTKFLARSFQTLLSTVMSLAATVVVALALGAAPAPAAAMPAPAAAEQATPQLPPGHSMDDGHDHSHDAHGAHEKAGVVPTAAQGIVPAIVALIVFSVVLGVLATQVWPKILGGLKDRENKIRDEIESAEMARKQAKEALEQYQQSLAQARSEAQKEIDRARAQAQAISAELKAKADIELSAMREKAMRDIDSAKRAAVAEIYTQSAQLAGAMASKILRRQVTAEDQQRLIEESLGQLEANRR